MLKLGTVKFAANPRLSSPNTNSQQIIKYIEIQMGDYVFIHLSLFSSFDEIFSLFVKQFAFRALVNVYVRLRDWDRKLKQRSALLDFYGLIIFVLVYERFFSGALPFG